MERLAEQFPLNYIIPATSRQKIIFTGTGFAGAIATHVCLKLMKHRHNL